MNRIITISREFGSGGRELGKRLAEALHIPCYDHEIIEMIAKENGFNEDYVAHMSEKSIEAAYPLTIGHRFGVPPFQIMDQPIRVAVAQRQILENFAKSGDCVIVGRGADVILKAYKPLNIFVYADKESKIERCQRRAPAGENMTASEIEKRMKQIDRNRSQHHQRQQRKGIQPHNVPLEAQRPGAQTVKAAKDGNRQVVFAVDLLQQDPEEQPRQPQLHRHHQ